MHIVGLRVAPPNLRRFDRIESLDDDSVGSQGTSGAPLMADINYWEQPIVLGGFSDQNSISENSIQKESAIPQAIIHASFGQVSSTEIDATQIGSIQISSSQVSSGEISTQCINARQIATDHTSSSQVSPFQTTAGQVTAGQITAGQIGISQVGILQNNASEIPLPSSVTLQQFLSSHNFNLQNTTIPTWTEFLTGTTPFNLKIEITDLPTGQLAEGTATGYDWWMRRFLYGIGFGGDLMCNAWCWVARCFTQGRGFDRTSTPQAPNLQINRRLGATK
jgi:hypothetical protein